MARGVLIAAAAGWLALALPGLAEVPDQAGWNAARQKVDIGGGMVAGFVELGAPPADATGTPIVLIHGYTNNARSWAPLAPALAAALPGRRILALELRGHGASSAPDCCYGPDSLAHDVDAALQALDIQRADLVGHSLGSITSAFLAATRPERVNRLVLVSTAIRMPPEPAALLWQNIPALGDPIDPDSPFMLAWFSNAQPVDPDFLAIGRAEAAAIPKHVWTGVLEPLTATDWSLLAPRITAPVTVMWGDQDGLFGPESQDLVKAALPKADHRTYAGGGHNFFWEQPQQTATDLAAILKD